MYLIKFTIIIAYKYERLNFSQKHQSEIKFKKTKIPTSA